MLGIRNVPERNRSKLDIIAEILRKLRQPTGKTNIMFHCNMSSAQSRQYLDYMESVDLVRIDGITGKVTYQKTDAGRDYLDLYNKMALLLDPSISAPALI
jgi:predicted transcriptional regulator